MYHMNDLHSTFSSGLVTIILAGSISTSFFSEVYYDKKDVRNKPYSIHIEHSLVDYQSYHNNITIKAEQILSEFVRNLIDEQLPPNLEFDNIIAENIWELYQYGFPS